jgi:uncharacterized protein YecT (DUF1311 family)
VDFNLNVLSLMILFSFVMPMSSHAAGRPEPSFSKQYDLCANKSEGVTVKLRECLGDEFERQDKELNRIYKALSPKLSPANRLILQKSERAWITYRDATCDFEGSSESGGTLEFTINGECRIRQTLYRIEDLKKRLEFVKQYPEDDE